MEQKKIFAWHFGFTVQGAGRGDRCPARSLRLCAGGRGPVPLGTPAPSHRRWSTSIHHRLRESGKHGGRQNRGTQPESWHPPALSAALKSTFYLFLLKISPDPPLVPHRGTDAARGTRGQDPPTPCGPTYGSRTSRPSSQAGRRSGPSGGRRAPRDGTRSAAGSPPRAVPARTLGGGTG